MLATAGSFSLLLQTLRLTQVVYKPTPDAPKAVIETGPGNTIVYDPDYESFTGSPPTNDQQFNTQQCYVKPYDAPAFTHQTFLPFDEGEAMIYRYRKQQSVNLGSWFVAENWMTPSVFNCAAGKKVSELDIASGWGSPTNARALLERHWDTWITEADFQYLQSVGINTVRLPIGYWSLGPDYCKNTPFAPYAGVYKNSWPRVVRTINLANQYGIGVLVDLHGAPGSQNGQGHSGISDGHTGLFESEAYIKQTIDVLTYLAEHLSVVNNVVGIQVLNEPTYDPTLIDFYTRAITAMRKVSPAAYSMPLYVHDGFDLERFSLEFTAKRDDFVVQDHHSYYVFTPKDATKPASDHTQTIDTTISFSLATVSARQRDALFIGEWSCALTPQSLSGEQDQGEARRQFCTDQMEVYTNNTAGWSFWSYKKEDCDTDPGWCFKAAVGTALPETFFSYGRRPTESQTQAIAAMSSNTPFNSILTSVTQAGGLPEKGSLLSPIDSSALRHRATIIHARRRQTDSHPTLSERDNNGAGETMEGKGYAEGFSTAQLFAVHSQSKLGFTGQYVADSLKKMGASALGQEKVYSDAFRRGLVAGQEVVASMVKLGGLS